MKLGDLYVTLTAKGAEELQQKLKITEQQANKLEKTLKTVSNALGAMGVAVTAFATKAVYDFTRYTSEVDKMVKVTGASAEAIQELGYAAEQEHGSMQDLSIGLKNLARVMGDANDGLAESKRTFDKLGESIVDQQGNLRNVTDILLATADKFSRMTNETEKTSLALELFGRSGVNLVPFLSLGRAEIERLTKEARSLGIVLKDETIKQGKALDDQLVKLKTSFKTLSLDVAEKLMPTLRSLIDQVFPLVDLLKKLPGWLVTAGVELLAFTGLMWGLQKALVAVGIASGLASKTGLIGFLLWLGYEGVKIVGNWNKKNEDLAKGIERTADALDYASDKLAKAQMAMTGGKKEGDKSKTVLPPLTNEEQLAAMEKYYNELERTQLAEEKELMVKSDLHKMLYGEVGLIKNVNTALEYTAPAIEKINALAQSFATGFGNIMSGAVTTFADTFVEALWGAQVSFADFINSLVKQIIKLMVQVAALGLLMRMFGIPPELLGLTGKIFDNPKDDMWAMKQGADFGRNFREGFARTFKTPETQPQPVYVNVYNATPSTYIEVFRKFPLKDKQRFYETGIYEGQKRFEKR